MNVKRKENLNFKTSLFEKKNIYIYKIQEK